MSAARVIPCLDIDAGRVVKGVRFRNLRDAGDPVERARAYALGGADELVFLDVGATVRSRKILIEVVERVSAEVFIPLTVGGGIQTVGDFREILRAGADKVSMATAAVLNPGLIADAAAAFGSQCVVLSVDALRAGASWEVMTHGGRRPAGLSAVDWACRAAALGAGEILLNSIDRDGTGRGYDLELIRAVSEAVDVPVIASGGAGGPDQMAEAVLVGRADAVLAASILHDGLWTISDIKARLRAGGVEVR
ncbi:MAG: imidazole glycerol phosphate synthase subunit HisF [Candidatus Aminicenantes bacterium]|nr:imidazole glycerol phosphate synthase subunit HisF [Candidatus Aminicenantes bacterium]